MPRVRRGPDGPTSSAGGAPGTNKPTPHQGAGVSGNSHQKDLGSTDGKGYYGPKAGGKGYRS